MTSFDEYYRAIHEASSLTLDPSWGQGKTSFGGMSAAMALASLERELPQDAPLRSLAINFCGPLATGEPFDTQTRVLRAGRSVTHIQAEVHQNDQCATILTACYGAERISDVAVVPTVAAPGEPGAGQRLSYIPGITPEFVQHIDFSYVSGGLPFSGSKDNHIHGWMRFKEVSGPLSEVHLVALIDAWPPATLQKLRSPAPCASVTWSLDICTPLSTLPTTPNAGDWLWYEVDIVAAGHGYAQTTARIYLADGTLLALSRQLVVVYDKR